MDCQRDAFDREDDAAMMELVFFLGIGIAILILLVLLVQDRVPPDSGGVRLEELPDARVTFEWEVPSVAVAERIFALDDWAFVSGQASRSVQRLFVKERKAIAIGWLRNTRNAVRKIMDFHRRTVRRNANVRPLAEVRLGINYVFFLLAYHVLYGVIWGIGPFRAQSMALQAASRAEEISRLCGTLSARLQPERERFGDNSIA